MNELEFIFQKRLGILVKWTSRNYIDDEVLSMHSIAATLRDREQDIYKQVLEHE